MLGLRRKDKFQSLLSYTPGNTLLVNTEKGKGPIEEVNLKYTSFDSADGLTEIQVNIGGANSNLGNPVDIMYSGSDLFVAEKSNNVIMRFDNILASEGGDIAANATISFNAPESVALIPHYISE